MTVSEPGGTAQSSRPRRLFLYGSCVSRDSAEFFPSERYALLRYVARQSLISAFAPRPTQLNLTRIESRFQRRMLEGDAQGDLTTLLEEAHMNIDLLVWDVTDERLGVLAGPDGEVVTKTVEGISAGLAGELVNFRPIAFGSDEHFALWTVALERFTALLVRLDLLERTVLLRVPWAERSDDGNPVPASFGLTSGEANALYQRYYDEAASRFMTESFDPSTIVTSSRHRWGAAPFHYTDETYQEIVLRIERRIGSSAGIE